MTWHLPQFNENAMMVENKERGKESVEAGSL